MNVIDHFADARRKLLEHRTDYQRRIGLLRKCLTVNEHLEAICSEHDKPLLQILKPRLERGITLYRTLETSVGQSLDALEQTQHEYERAIQSLADAGINQERLKRVEEGPETPRHKEFVRYARKMLIYGCCSVLSLPFSREIAKAHFGIAKMYSRALKGRVLAKRRAKTVRKIQAQILALRYEKEKGEARFATKLRHVGFEENLADRLAMLSPDEFICTIVEGLRQRYNLPDVEREGRYEP